MSKNTANPPDQILIGFRTDTPGIGAVITGTPGKGEDLGQTHALFFVDLREFHKAMREGKPVHVAGGSRLTNVREIERITPPPGPLPRLIIDPGHAWAEAVLKRFPAVGADRTDGTFLQDPQTGSFGKKGELNSYILRGHNDNNGIIVRRVTGNHDIAQMFRMMTAEAGLTAQDVGSFRRVARRKVLTGPEDQNGRRVTLDRSEGGAELIFALRRLPELSEDAAALMTDWFPRDRRVPLTDHNEVQPTARAAVAMEELLDLQLIELIERDGRSGYQLTDKGLEYPVRALPEQKYGVAFAVYERKPISLDTPSP